MSCSSCNSSSMGRIGHFGKYVQASNKQIYRTTGPVQSAPNFSAGMHGLSLDSSTLFNFSPQPTDWIAGVPNGVIVVGGLALVLFSVMK